MSMVIIWWRCYNKPVFLALSLGSYISQSLIRVSLNKTVRDHSLIKAPFLESKSFTFSQFYCVILVMFIYVNTMTETMFQTILVSIMINYFILKPLVYYFIIRDRFIDAFYELWPESSNNKPIACELFFSCWGA